ncbi:MAG: chemotaxis protein CheX [Cellulomonas sp.]|nr:chemotaxis protein CheX [Cellulomonas sp.]
MSAMVDSDSVFAIAESVFSAMIDGDEGLLLPWEGDLPIFADPLYAWVDLLGDWRGRAALTTETQTAHALARALLMMADDEPVDGPDLVDAFGEIANVVGGNVKALLPTQGTLGLPQVAAQLPPHEGGSLSQELRLSWRGQPIVVAVWLFG